MVWQVVSACYQIALAAETGVLRGHIVTQNLTFAAAKRAILVAGHENTGSPPGGSTEGVNQQVPRALITGITGQDGL